MRNWDNLIAYLEQYWCKSSLEIYKQLIPTIRYAIFAPLDSVKALSSLLASQATSVEVENWANKCQHKCLNWVNKYWEIQENCIANSNHEEITCKCILQDVASLFDEVEVLWPSRLLLNLMEEEIPKSGDLLSQKLAAITRIHTELQSQNFSWLLEYIIKQDKLREE